MKKWIRFELVIVLFAIAIITCEGCKEKSDSSSPELALNSEELKSVTVKESKKPVSEDFKKYWYAGNAEITSYKLEQARYGEVREGTSVLIYVTEPFLPEVQVKADRSNATNIPVLKLNATKKYLTGIYPYSIMSSTFYPVHGNKHAIKTSLSVQEWCGHVYSQLNNRNDFEFTSHSYFEGEADQNIKLDKAILENEIWNKIRINPKDLPTGELKIIPSLEYFRTKHQDIKALPAQASLTNANGISSYTIDYGTGVRKLTINFTTEFPHTIESWAEEFRSGYGANAKTLTSTGTKLKSIKTPYWRQNSNKFISLRDSLGL
ncbi:septum formation inhibitor Maf [uncultured Croceitalea sp.]|uniref:septum formation inhibitor Maf n=1 Tax=uncultured Croceitalea sp. TaxID=1798908 RepID=UPI00374FC92B